MATATTLSEYDEGERIDVSELSTIVEDEFFSGCETYRITGSLLDYVVDEQASVLTYEVVDDRVQYRLAFDWPEGFPEDKESTQRSRITDTFLRAGITSHPNLDDVMRRLRDHDDVIIGIDSNVLWDCLFTSYLLEEIYAEPFPNWILIAVPRLVMAETENAANSKIDGGNHPRVGWPSYKGRVGHRALQEAMMIRQADPNRPGLAMMSVGDVNGGTGAVNRDNWRIDALIRNQFQGFLDDINFHKGTFFLSQDRVNVMMSGTEGSQGLYLQKPGFETLRTGSTSLTGLTRLVFELCLQFGEVTLEGEERKLSMEVFWPGKQVSDWRDSRLNISEIRR
jgi:hypothetical protein